MKPIISVAVAAAAVSILGLTAAQAGTVTISAQNALGATKSPFLLDNPGASPAGFVSNSSVNVGGATVTFSPDSTPPARAGIYAGNTSDVASSPFTGTGLQPTNYFVAEPGDPVTFALNSSRTTFDLLWGSVGTTDSLTLEHCTNGSSCTGATTVTGSEIIAAAGFADPGNLTGYPAFVELTDTTAFNEIVMTSGSPAFEFEPQDVPEPMTLSILGTGMIGLAVTRRRTRRAA